MKSTFIQCPVDEVVRTYCCLCQAGSSLVRGYGRQPEVRHYLKARSPYYDMPSFLEGHQPEENFTQEDSVAALKSLDDRPLSEKTKVILVSVLPNKFRRKTVLLDTLLLRYLHINFRRMQGYLDSTSEDIPAAANLRYQLYVSFESLAANAGGKHFAKAQSVEHFNQGFSHRHYDFAEILDDV